MRIKRGDIWVVDLGEGAGCEQRGVRPCVVVQNDIGNLHSQTIIVCPITTKSKGSLPTHVDADGLKQKSMIKCEQIRTIAKSRVKFKVASISTESLDEALRLTLGL